MLFHDSSSCLYFSYFSSFERYMSWNKARYLSPSPLSGRIFTPMVRKDVHLKVKGWLFSLKKCLVLKGLLLSIRNTQKNSMFKSIVVEYSIAMPETYRSTDTFDIIIHHADGLVLRAVHPLHEQLSACRPTHHRIVEITVNKQTKIYSFQRSWAVCNIQEILVGQFSCRENNTATTIYLVALRIKSKIRVTLQKKYANKMSL